MRVISGKLKGKQLKGFDIDGTRPTMDRVKESFFAMIQDYIKDSICLDLFAGSGSLGIEAISNGAAFVYFVDKDKVAFKTINENIFETNIKDKCEVLLSDYQEALNIYKKKNISFDIIFLDPPYQSKIINGILKYLDVNNLLKENGIVVCELSSEILDDSYGSLNIIKNKKYGDKEVMIYQNIK